jgi:hypothetical protein
MSAIAAALIREFLLLCKEVVVLSPEERALRTSGPYTLEPLIQTAQGKQSTKTIRKHGVKLFAQCPSVDSGDARVCIASIRREGRKFMLSVAGVAAYNKAKQEARHDLAAHMVSLLSSLFSLLSSLFSSSLFSLLSSLIPLLLSSVFARAPTHSQDHTVLTALSDYSEASQEYTHTEEVAGVFMQVMLGAHTHNQHRTNTRATQHDTTQHTTHTKQHTELVRQGDTTGSLSGRTLGEMDW